MADHLIVVHLGKGGDDETLIVVDVPDVDLFVLNAVGCFPQIFVDCTGSLVVQFAMGHCDAVNFEFEQGTENDVSALLANDSI